jgi:hypothetical protein
MFRAQWLPNRGRPLAGYDCRWGPLPRELQKTRETLREQVEEAREGRRHARAVTHAD